MAPPAHTFRSRVLARTYTTQRYGAKGVRTQLRRHPSNPPRRLTLLIVYFRYYTTAICDASSRKKKRLWSGQNLSITHKASPERTHLPPLPTCRWYFSRWIKACYNTLSVVHRATALSQTRPVTAFRSQALVGPTLCLRKSDKGLSVDEANSHTSTHHSHLSGLKQSPHSRVPLLIEPAFFFCGAQLA